MAHDQTKFSSLIDYTDFNLKIKAHVLSCYMQIACSFHDIETIKFLLNYGVDIKNFVIIDKCRS